MSVPIRLRRPFVILGVILSLAAGAATIRAAAAWTAASAPLVDKPPSVETLQASLADEQARSAGLLTQLETLATGSADLTLALEAARDQIAADAVQAADLQASLDVAKARLATLERSIRQARDASAAQAIPVIASRPAARTDESEHEDDHEDEEREDDDD